MKLATNAPERDQDLWVPNVHDGRRWEIVAEGLPMFGGVQLVVDTTLVSPWRGDSSPRRNVGVRDGVALQAARRCKERTYPELVELRARAWGIFTHTPRTPYWIFAPFLSTHLFPFEPHIQKWVIFVRGDWL